MLLADLLNASRLSGTGDGLKKEGSPTPDFDLSPAAPRLDFQRFNTHIVRQNVAGLWLKYGAKSAKIEVFWRPRNKLHDATIC